MTLEDFVNKLAEHETGNYYDYEIRIGNATIRDIHIDDENGTIIIVPTPQQVRELKN